jgi:Small-conductance mechanosensitive channel
MEGDFVKEVLSEVVGFFDEFSSRLLQLALVLVLGLFIEKYLVRFIKRLVKKGKLDATLASFFLSLTKIFIRLMIIINILTAVGVNAGSLTALLASLGAALALGFRNTLGNFTSGVTILLLKPFHIGDYIEIGAFVGTVKEIQVMSTILNTPDNKRVIIPNGNITNVNVINYTVENRRRIDYKITLTKDQDLDNFYKLIAEVLEKEELILKKPSHSIDIINYDLYKVILRLKFWCEGSEVSHISASFLKSLYERCENDKVKIII